jgi:ubiquitin-conjugating enzyme (huntingtin interacting protein 2)
MLLKTPREFERVAREWAVIYAGAPVGEDDNRTASRVEDTRLGAAEDSLAK